MKRRADSLKRNAQKGALKMWCPACKRKQALDTRDICRYCGVRAERWSVRRPLLRAWLAEDPKERNPHNIWFGGDND